MILLLCTDMYEQGTDPVVGWLAKSKSKVMRLCLKDLVAGRADLEINVHKQRVYLNGIDLCEEVNVVWFRGLEERHREANPEDQFRKMVGLDKTLNDEAMDVVEYLFYALRHKTWLPHYGAVKLNKLIALEVAAKHGLRIPETRILTRKKKVLESYNLWQNGMITKPIHRNVLYRENENAYISFTHRLDHEDLQVLPSRFFASLYQEFLDAEFEIRVFYLNGKFEALALMLAPSQGRAIDSKLDRIAGKMRHERFVLNEKESSMLISFLTELGLNICTMDMMWKDGEIVLLDVNPLGQYLFESQISNTYLEKDIAEWLISIDRGMKNNRYAFS
ncbi:RimK family alpha-L-glutamate ligase [Olivibacter sp. XZL3]|uniref:ATP-grasp domain-containing protein n=1 Tax=Olivibacter sp. XZL3 TaxID=1735116 RepID=UPI0010647335|nr:hypothetical protein [Olivibacter sp. XZL3]